MKSIAIGTGVGFLAATIGLLVQHKQLMDVSRQMDKLLERIKEGERRLNAIDKTQDEDLSMIEHLYINYDELSPRQKSEILKEYNKTRCRRYNKIMRSTN